MPKAVVDRLDQLWTNLIMVHGCIIDSVDEFFRNYYNIVHEIVYYWKPAVLGVVFKKIVTQTLSTYVRLTNKILLLILWTNHPS
jgi:hypothetical protein